MSGFTEKLEMGNEAWSFKPSSGGLGSRLRSDPVHKKNSKKGIMNERAKQNRQR